MLFDDLYFSKIDRGELFPFEGRACTIEEINLSLQVIKYSYLLVP